MSKGATTAEATIPEYQKQQQRSLFGAAQAVANQPFVPYTCLLYTSPSPRDRQKSRMPSSA